MQGVARYHPVLVAMHWVLALLIIAALALGALVLAPIPNTDPMKLEGVRTHMIGGLVILAAMLVRLFLRRGTRHPPAAAAGSAIFDRLAWISHRVLYLLVIAQGVSGLLMGWQSGALAAAFDGVGALPPDFWAFSMRSVHYAVSRLLMALIALHIAGALYHTAVLRDGLLRRMWFGKRSQIASRGAAPARSLPESRP